MEFHHSITSDEVINKLSKDIFEIRNKLLKQTDILKSYFDEFDNEIRKLFRSIDYIDSTIKLLSEVSISINDILEKQIKEEENE